MTSTPGAGAPSPWGYWCARMPVAEAARVPVRPGASVLLDPANRVSAGWNVTQLTDPQAEP